MCGVSSKEIRIVMAYQEECSSDKEAYVQQEVEGREICSFVPYHVSVYQVRLNRTIGHLYSLTSALTHRRCLIKRCLYYVY